MLKFLNKALYYRFRAFLLEEMAPDENLCWYHGSLSREEADEILLSGNDKEDGNFLVRESSSATGDYVLSVLHQGEVIHYQIRRHGEDAFFSIEEQTIIHGLETLIEYYEGERNGLICRLRKGIPGGPPPHDSRRHGRTNLLHRATKEGNLCVVSELLKCGYRSLEAKNREGETAVHLASRSGEEGILKKLLESGANVNCRDKRGNTPLHYACQNNLIKIVKILIHNGGANVQLRNTETGWVSLHEAASRGHSEIVEALISVRAPLRPRTINGETPEDLARKNGHLSTVSFLASYDVGETKSKREDWYHGTLDRGEANALMKEGGDNEEGKFLVRFSYKSGYVLTMQSAGQIFHFQIKQENGYYVIDDGPLLDSLEHIVDHYRLMPDGLPSTLQKPLRPKPKPPLPQMQFSTLPLKGKRAMVGGSLGVNTDRKSEGMLTLPPKPKPRLSLDEGRTVGPPFIFPQPDEVQHKQESQHKDVFIPEENIIINTEEVLGEGEFGSVYKGLYQTKKGSEELVAVKMLHEDRLTSDNREEFIREAKVMMNLNHHCIVRLIGLSQGSTLLMVQELVPLGSMLTFLQKHRQEISAEYELHVWASQIACGMNYLEERRMVHRDLAARNILLSTRHQAKISDFGLSRGFIGEREYYRATQGGRWPIKWYAPESFNYGEFSSASDVWSFGVTLWEMFSYGAQPYGMMKGVEVINLVERGERLERPPECPEIVYRTMERCWAYKARERPTFRDLLIEFASNTNYENVKCLIPHNDIS